MGDGLHILAGVRSIGRYLADRRVWDNLGQQFFVRVLRFKVQEDRHARSRRLFHRAQDVVSVIPVDVQICGIFQLSQVGGVQSRQQFRGPLVEIGAGATGVGDGKLGHCGNSGIDVYLDRQAKTFDGGGYFLAEIVFADGGWDELGFLSPLVKHTSHDRRVIPERVGQLADRRSAVVDRHLINDHQLQITEHTKADHFAVGGTAG